MFKVFQWQELGYLFFNRGRAGRGEKQRIVLFCQELFPPPGHPPASLGLFRLGKAKVTVYLNVVSEFISSKTYQEPVFLSCSTKFVFIQLNKDP